jgi:hypothetical protein
LSSNPKSKRRKSKLPAYEYSPSSANNTSASSPLKISSQVKKSSGNVPPMFSLNIAKIYAISSGFMCLAASNLNPERPI